MKINEFKCDNCGKREPSNYNGEHYISPLGWYQLYCDHLAEVILNIHICPECVPFKIKKKLTKEQTKGDE